MTAAALDLVGAERPFAIRFRVPGVPVSQGRMVSFGRGPLVHANEKQLKPWRNKVHTVAAAAMRGAEPLTGPVAVGVLFALPRPKTVRRALPTGRLDGDIDKLLRAILDALTARDDKGLVTGVYVDDSQVVDLDPPPRKRYAGSPGSLSEPGVEITVREVTA